MPIVRGSLLRALMLPLALAAAAAPLGAQGTVADQGTFRVSVDGRPVGTEEFTIRQTGTGASTEVVATGRVDLSLPTGSLVLVPRLRATGLQSDPVAYQVDVGGDSPSKIVGTLGAGRFSTRVITGTGEQLREYVASQGALVLDEGVAHHYYFLAQRLRNGRVPVIIPRENRQVMATVTYRGEEPVEVGDARASLFHLVVQVPGSGDRHVWVDALNRVIRVEIPDRSYLAVRTTLPR